jgi:uncharacterized RDD family membrane protein YckC
MKSWRIRLVQRDGRAMTPWRSLVRYLLSWLWFMPACVVLYLWGVHSTAMIFGVMLAGVGGYALAAFAHPSRQFLHDVICGTRIVEAPQKA